MERVRDVVVIGGGPAGLHAAYRLAAGNLDVVLLEAQPRIGEGAICSGVIGEEAFARFDLPTSSVLTKIHCIQAISPRGRKLTHMNDAPLARVVDKGEFNRGLEERARQAGAEILAGRRVLWLKQERQGVVLGCQAANDCLRARIALIASGVNLCFNRVLGLARPRQFLRAVQADVALSNGHHAAPTRVYVGQSVAPGAFGWEIPLGNGKARVGLMTTRDDPKPYFTALVRRLAPTVDESALSLSQKPIAQAPRGRCATDRVLTIGEAAGHVKTSTGGGIYYGLLSAEFAAEVTLRAFQKGFFSAQVLGDFERYWRTSFSGELLVGYFARKLAGHLSDHQIERVFEAANVTSLLPRLNGRLKFDWHHRALLAALGSLIALPIGIGQAGSSP